MESNNYYVLIKPRHYFLTLHQSNCYDLIVSSWSLLKTLSFGIRSFNHIEKVSCEDFGAETTQKISVPNRTTGTFVTLNSTKWINFWTNSLIGLSLFFFISLKLVVRTLVQKQQRRLAYKTGKEPHLWRWTALNESISEETPRFDSLYIFYFSQFNVVSWLCTFL